MKQTNNLDTGIFNYREYVGYKVAEYNPQKIFLRGPEWFVVEYPSQSGFSEGRRRLAFS